MDYYNPEPWRNYWLAGTLIGILLATFVIHCCS